MDRFAAILAATLAAVTNAHGYETDTHALISSVALDRSQLAYAQLRDRLGLQSLNLDDSPRHVVNVRTQERIYESDR